MAVGITYPHYFDFPGSYDFSFNDFTAISQVKLGPLTINEDDEVFVSGPAIWEKEIEHYHAGQHFPITRAVIATQVNQFDAMQSGGISHSIVILTYAYNDEFSFDSEFDVWLVNGQQCWRDLVIDGTIIGQAKIFEVTDYAEGGAVYEVDNRTFLPFWINPRCLQSSETAQGGGHRKIVFQRTPFDPAEANSL